LPVLRQQARDIVMLCRRASDGTSDHSSARGASCVATGASSGRDPPISGASRSMPESGLTESARLISWPAGANSSSESAVRSKDAWWLPRRSRCTPLPFAVLFPSLTARYLAAPGGEDPSKNHTQERVTKVVA
jgi:hypothetical protein